MGVCAAPPPSGFRFQLFVGGEEALGEAAAVFVITHIHTHSRVIARDTVTLKTESLETNFCITYSRNDQRMYSKQM